MDIMQLVKRYSLLAGTPFIEFFGGLTSAAAFRNALPAALTYLSGTAVAIDASLGNAFAVSINDAVAFSIAAPSNAPASTFQQQMTLTIRNTSGGALGAGTWAAIFKTDGNVPAIANGKNRTFGFVWNGTNWILTFQSAADVSN